MKRIITIISLLGAFYSAAQYQVGHTTVTFNDPSRTGGYGSGGGAGRQIQTEIYYPAAVAGTDVPVSVGTFPVIVFGHGFAMSWDAYANIWEKLVPEGYILAFPRTEGGLFPSPSHSEFGFDLALVVTKMQELNTLNGSLLEGKLSGKNAIMGHSMGGGATMLAAQNNAAIQTIVGLAPAETTPSAITAAAQVSVPALILSGSSDGVTPPADNHLPIYNAFTSSCKFFLSLLGGAHCQFANSNFNCDFGESTSSTGITMTRVEQQTAMFDYILPWFDFYLKGECTAWNSFLSPQAADQRIQPTSSCSYQPLQAPVITLGSGVLVSSIPSNVQWFLNGQPLAGETNATVSLTYGDGSYTVATIAVDALGCNAISAPYLYGSTTGLEENALYYNIFPNPATDHLIIEPATAELYNLQVFSVEGKKIYESYQSGEASIATSFWGKGVYLVRLTSNGMKTNRLVQVK